MNKSLNTLGEKLITKGETAKESKELNKQVQDRMNYKGMTKAEAMQDIARTSSNLNSEKGLD